MKKLFMLLMFVFPMAMASHHALAQEVTINLVPGWNWISYPKAEAMSIATALGDFSPIQGDKIRSQYSMTTYNNGRWRGNIQQFTPGTGYMYYSNRTEAVSLVFNQANTQIAVTTATPGDITLYSASFGGEVTDTGNSAIVVHGLCWGTEPNPTVAGSHTIEGMGTGSFSHVIETLEMNTIYYVRAYALTENGMVYGNEQSFSTLTGIPVVSTAEVTEIGDTYATCGGSVSDDGGLEVTERGICWSTNANPTIAGDHIANGAGLGSFTVDMTDLEPGTTYYVRAYATNSNTTAYGDEMSFTTENSSLAPTGAIDGKFTINEEGDQVYFSQGNLQYIGSASTPYWKFADNQWDYLGTTTGQNSSDQNVDRDLFGWATSGYDHGANCYQPWSTSQTNHDYLAYGDYMAHLYDQTGQADWGYNPIHNGGNQANQWRTLTRAEWIYVFNSRTTSSGIRYAKANVNNVNGVILLPDDWNTTYYELNYTNTSDANYNTNVITASDWDSLEQHGAVFLPAAGYRYVTNVYSEGSSGYYWSASRSSSSDAYRLKITSSSLLPGNTDYRPVGESVRLVHNAE